MILKVVSPKGKYKDDGVYQAVAQYCTDVHKMKSGYLTTRNLDEDNIADDMYQLTEHFGKLKGTRIRHMVLSFDKKLESHITAEIAYVVADAVCNYYSEDYQIFAAVHEEKPHIHIHVIMNTVNITTGKKYKGKKKDYYRFQTYLKKVLKRFGCKLQTEY